MNINDKNLQEARMLNQQSKQGISGMSNMAQNAIANADLQEAKQLNQQSASKSSSAMTASTMDKRLQEAKQLNQQSASQKR